MHTQIICLKQDDELHFYALKNQQWDFDRLKSVYVEQNKDKYSLQFDWRGHFDSFHEFIIKRGAVQINDFPVLQVDEYPDIDY